ncbi:hypothetical protein CAPTEDRAFT_223635 [Capitella teleta]|uniref:Gustatory receptor n=1 Tax=Capitella teleta TaxID=283909 RepID=R7UX01_CAPTE|nr:hypothetical protein CAPTEDRAFT_223635 [Capitella teleta]|eukprot:ELU10797.1 hypothetical protein CAPTEDRAFT_223635 [Capitella teleta]
MEVSSSKMTRKTIIYVEEISDTEKDTINKSFKQFGMSESDTGVPQCTAASNTDPKAPSLMLNAKELMDSSEAASIPRRRVAPANRGPKALSHGDNDLQTIEQSLLYKTLRPMFRVMEVVGLFFISKKTSHQQGIAGLIRNCTRAQAYCTFILFILIINFLRTVPALTNITSFGTVLFFKLLMIIFFYEAASRALIALISCIKKKGGLQEFYLNIDRVCYSDKIIPYEISLRHTMHGFLVMSLVLTLGNVAVMFYGFFFGPSDIQELFNLYLIPVPVDLPGILAFKLFNIVLTFINSAVALLSLSFYSITCYVLYKEFEYLCRTFSMKIKEDGTFIDDLEKFRLRHQKRCKLVEEADELFKAYIANTYLTNIPLLCLLLYNIVYTDAGSSIVYRYISAYRLLYVLSQMLVLSIIATIINNQAHAPLADIYSIKVQTCSRERQLEVTMFLNKLTGTSIGLSAWDMFVINKPTVMTVFGMILTYFFLLVQFKNPLNPLNICICEFERNDNTTLAFHGAMAD